MRVPSDVPVMTLTNVILFPHAMLPLHIFEPRYRRMLRDALASDRMFAVALQKPGRTREIPSPVAGLGLIRVAVDNRDGTLYAMVVDGQVFPASRWGKRCIPGHTAATGYNPCRWPPIRRSKRTPWQSA